MDFAPIFKLAETTHGRNDSWPKRPTKIGQIDSPQNKAETTQAETTRPKRPTAETTRIHHILSASADMLLYTLGKCFTKD